MLKLGHLPGSWSRPLHHPPEYWDQFPIRYLDTNRQYIELRCRSCGDTGELEVGGRTWWPDRECPGPVVGNDRPRREGISDAVKMFVWQRDGGRCVSCGDNRNLEFDHIIPVSMGGASTTRNIQLLCEACNRAKGGSLV